MWKKFFLPLLLALGYTNQRVGSAVFVQNKIYNMREEKLYSHEVYPGYNNLATLPGLGKLQIANLKYLINLMGNWYHVDDFLQQIDFDCLDKMDIRNHNFLNLLYQNANVLNLGTDDEKWELEHNFFTRNTQPYSLSFVNIYTLLYMINLQVLLSNYNTNHELLAVNFAKFAKANKMFNLENNIKYLLNKALKHEWVLVEFCPDLQSVNIPNKQLWLFNYTLVKHSGSCKLKKILLKDFVDFNFEERQLYSCLDDAENMLIKFRTILQDRIEKKINKFLVNVNSSTYKEILEKNMHLVSKIKTYKHNKGLSQIFSIFDGEMKFYVNRVLIARWLCNLEEISDFLQKQGDYLEPCWQNYTPYKSLSESNLPSLLTDYAKITSGNLSFSVGGGITNITNKKKLELPDLCDKLILNQGIVRFNRLPLDKKKYLINKMIHNLSGPFLIKFVSEHNFSILQNRAGFFKKLQQMPQKFFDKNINILKKYLAMDFFISLVANLHKLDASFLVNHNLTLLLHKIQSNFNINGLLNINPYGRLELLTKFKNLLKESRLVKILSLCGAQNSQTNNKLTYKYIKPHMQLIINLLINRDM